MASGIWHLRACIHAQGIVDTSTVVLLGRMDDPSLLPDEPLITAITLAELTVGPLVATTDHERVARQAHALPVYTCNPDDFAGIDGLDVVAVPAPQR